jgi:hypothetical protein
MLHAIKAAYRQLVSNLLFPLNGPHGASPDHVAS